MTPRVGVPFFAVWIYGLSVGEGYFAALCRNRFLVHYLSPASYSIYLLHQPVFEWYSLATRGVMWSQRKPFEWFSPDPIVLGWGEACLVVGITVLLSLPQPNPNPNPNRNPNPNPDRRQQLEISKMGDGAEARTEMWSQLLQQRDLLQAENA